MNRPTVLCLGFMLLSGLEARSQSRDLTEFLPSGKVEVDVINAALPKAQLVLTRKMEAGIAANREWFQTYMVEKAGQRPLPYHENFGLSRTEYKKLVAFSPADAKFKKVAAGEVEFRRPTLSTCTIHGAGLLSKVPVVTIDQDAETVKFPGLSTVTGQRFHRYKEGGPAGPMEAQRWTATDIEKPGGDGTVRSLALIMPLREKMLYFDFVHQVFKDKVPVVNERLIFRVPLKD